MTTDLSKTPADLLFLLQPNSQESASLVGSTVVSRS